MAILSRDQILRPDVAPTLESVPVPEWGGEGAEVMVGIISGRQRERVEAAIQAVNGGKARESFRAVLAAFAIRDADNKPILTEADVAALGETSGVALDRVFKAAVRINKMGVDDIEAEAKNSPPAP